MQQTNRALYEEVILEHNRKPRNFHSMEDAARKIEGHNPLCGDHIRIDLRVDENNRITEAAFSGQGCAISQASADMLVESIIGKTLDEVKALTKEHIFDLLGIDLGPVRVKCALLSLKVLKAGVYGLGEASDELVEK